MAAGSSRAELRQQGCTGRPRSGVRARERIVATTHLTACRVGLEGSKRAPFNRWQVDVTLEGGSITARLEVADAAVVRECCTVLTLDPL